VVGNVAEGMALYLQSCASCHGQQAAGTASGPSLTTAGTALVDFVLRTGRMPSNGLSAQSRRKASAFDDAQIQSLVAYLATLTTGPAIPDVNVSGANLSLGRDLFIQNCAACHGAGGAGGVVGGGFVAPPLDQADPKTVGEAALSGPGPMPQFSFTPDQLDAVAAYVQYLKDPPSPGGLAVAEIGPVAEGFLAGTIGIVTLLVVARWIARGRETDDATATDGEPTAGAGGDRPGTDGAA
jgi:ubiquinol-cytochrome c reductase cytochrome c subunit